MSSIPRVFIQAPTQALREVLTKAVSGHGTVQQLPKGDASWVRSWEELAGDVQDAEDWDVLVCAVDNNPDMGVLASVSHALFRKRCPVLLMAQTGQATQMSSILGADTQPLLEVQQWSAEGDVTTAVTGYLTPPAQYGRIFTVEGGDGAGKQTQTKMLVERLRREGYPVQTLDFPRDCAKYGKEVRVILSGKHGSISEVSPLLFSTLYAMNRHDQRPVLRHWLRRGYNVVLDRYMESNFGHQCAKLDDEKDRRRLISQLQAYECRWLDLPQSSRVAYLDLDPEAALRAMQNDTSRATLDIHETAKAGYKQCVRQCFRWCCGTFREWDCVTCSEGDAASFRRVSREDVHENIWSLWNPDFVNRVAHP